MRTCTNDHSKLIWSILASMIVVVGLMTIGGGVKAGWNTAPAAPMVRNPIFVELRATGKDHTVYVMPRGTRMLDVFRAAKMMTPPECDAYRKMKSGESITVSRSGKVTLGRMDGGKMVALGIKIPLRSASKKDLEAVPGIGRTLSRRILEYVATADRIDSLSDLAAVKGVGILTLERLQRYTSL